MLGGCNVSIGNPFSVDFPHSSKESPPTTVAVCFVDKQAHEPCSSGTACESSSGPNAQPAPGGSSEGSEIDVLCLHSTEQAATPALSDGEPKWYQPESDLSIFILSDALSDNARDQCEEPGLEPRPGTTGLHLNGLAFTSSRLAASSSLVFSDPTEEGLVPHPKTPCSVTSAEEKLLEIAVPHTKPRRTLSLNVEIEKPPQTKAQSSTSLRRLQRGSFVRYPEDASSSGSENDSDVFVEQRPSPALDEHQCQTAGAKKRRRRSRLAAKPWASTKSGPVVLPSLHFQEATMIPVEIAQTLQPPVSALRPFPLDIPFMRKNPDECDFLERWNSFFKDIFSHRQLLSKTLLVESMRSFAQTVEPSFIPHFRCLSLHLVRYGVLERDEVMAIFADPFP